MTDFVVSNARTTTFNLASGDSLSLTASGSIVPMSGHGVFGANANALTIEGDIITRSGPESCSAPRDSESIRFGPRDGADHGTQWGERKWVTQSHQCGQHYRYPDRKHRLGHWRRQRRDSELRTHLRGRFRNFHQRLRGTGV